MKSNTILGIIAVVILAGGGYFIYNKLDKDKSDISIIINSGKHSNKDFLKTMDAGFLKSWANAIKAFKDTFEYNNKSYKTQGGTAVK